MDKLIVGANGEATISNDGATILKLLEVVHPAAKTLVDIARAQDAEVGDGTTSVVLLAGEFLRESKVFIEDGVSPHVIIKGYRRAAQLVRLSLLPSAMILTFRILKAIQKVKDIAVTIERTNEAYVTPFPLIVALLMQRANSDFRDLLLKCASTAMSSKLIHSQKPFFSNMVVDAVLTLDQIDLDESLIGMKKIPGGGMEDSILVKGVAFKKTFSYAGFEQQPKSFKDPKILCLSVELELKAERDNAEVRIEAVSVRPSCIIPQTMTDAWIDDRNTKRSSTQNGQSSTPNSKPSPTRAPKSFSPDSRLEISPRNTLPIEISFALDE